MKLSSVIMLFFAGIFAVTNAAAQANASLNILTQNGGVVGKGGTVFLEVTVNNLGPVSDIGTYKIKIQISVPSEIVSIPATGHSLPAGWAINSNNGSTINLTNGTDVIASNDARNLLIALQGGSTIGGPSTIVSQLSFSNGISPGTAPGILVGDNTADNSSTSTIQVANVAPVTLQNFDAALKNCEPVLSWTTGSEINSDRFEIERGNMNNSGWVTAGKIAANRNASAKSKYSFTDRDLTFSSKQVLYRLKMIDKDEQYTYSDIVSVSLNCKTLQANVYPNPAKNGRLTIDLTGSGGSAEATLRALSGQVMLKAKKLNNGVNYINVSNIVNGSYILQITDANGLNKKVTVIIQR